MRIKLMVDYRQTLLKIQCLHNFSQVQLHKKIRKIRLKWSSSYSQMKKYLIMIKNTITDKILDSFSQRDLYNLNHLGRIAPEHAP